MKTKFLKNLDYINLILTLIVIILVFTFNLNLDKHLKLFFLLISLIICIYDLNYFIPFVVTFLIITIYNFKKKNNNIEYFENDKDLNKKNFIKEIEKIPFFDDLEYEKKKNIYDILKKIYKKSKNSKIVKAKDLYNILKLEDKYNRNGIITNIFSGENKDLKLNLIIGLLFYYSPKRGFYKFMYKISKQLGLVKIFNNDLINRTKKTNDVPENLKLNLQKAIISYFIEKTKKKLKDEKKKTKTNDIIEYIISNSDDYYSDEIDNIFNVNLDLNIIKANTNFNKYIKNIFKINLSEYGFNYYTNSKETLFFNPNLVESSSKLDVLDLKKNIDKVIEELQLFDNILKKEPPYNRLKKTLELYTNIYSLVLINDPHFKKKNIKDFEEQYEDFFKKLNEKNINNDKFTSTNHEILLNLNDIYYNSLQLATGDKYIEGLLEEYDPPSFETPSFGPSVTEDVDFDNSELKKFFDISKISGEKESQLEKYQKAMNFNNGNLTELSKQAEIELEKKKITDLSFNKVVDNFNISFFDIIDKLGNLFNKTINKKKINNLDFYLTFSKEFITIISTDNNILPMGCVFVLIGLFIFFIDSTTDIPKQDISLLDYLQNIKI